MTTSTRSADVDDRRRGSRSTSRDSLDDLRCRAQGIQEQAQYHQEQTTALDKARDGYDKARAAYNTARSTAEQPVKEARERLEACVPRVTCRIDESDLQCLGRAYQRVADRLRRCGDAGGCCTEDDCDYDDDVRRCEPEDVAGLIEDVRQRTEEATACFNDLIKEPDPALPARVAAVRVEVEAIEAAVDAGTTEPIELYSRILVARRHLKAVWRGFPTVNDYMDCLRDALTCMIKGHAAIGELKRKAAVAACHRTAWQQACQRLASDTVAEVLAEYIRLCKEDGHEGRPEEPPGAGYGEESEPGYGERPEPEPEPGYGERPEPEPQPAYGGRPGGGYGEEPEPGYGERPEPEPQPAYGGRPGGGYGEEPEPEPGPGYGGRPGRGRQPSAEAPGYRATSDTPAAAGGGREGPSSQRRAAGRPYRDERGRYRAP